MEPYPGHPGLYRKRVGYSMLFRVAAQTGEASFLPLIRQFDDVKYAPEIRYYAVQSYQQLEMKVSLSSAAPAPERGKSRAAIG